MTLAAPEFVFITCQRGVEPALKHELARDWPAWRFSFSRPGFVTYKLPADTRLLPGFALGSVFSRAWGISLERITIADRDAACRQVAQRAGELSARRLHVWSRDLATPGHRGYEPGLTTEALELREQLLRQLPPGSSVQPGALALPGELILDCVLVEPDQWWLGYHQAGEVTTRYPGGLLDVELPADAVSRAYLKMEEALRWSELPIRAGDRCAEIGSAPGGASQALLRRGLHVMGIDPAEMHPHLLAQPNFVHVRKRGHEVRRREFRHVRWLTADINVAPSYTLDTVEAIVTHPEVHVRGLLLTLKLLNWNLAEDIPDYLDRVRSWGYDEVRARQLQYNRQEICVAALRSKA